MTIVLLGQAPDALAAQDPGAPGLAAPAAPVAAALEPRALVRVRPGGGAHFWGTLVSRSADTLVLTGGEPGRLRPVAIADVDTLWVRRGAYPLEGAFIGGTALGGSLGFLAHGLSEGNAMNDGMEAGAFGFLVGAMVGAAVGMVVPRWARVFP